MSAHPRTIDDIGAAKLVADNLPQFRGDARVYSLNPPLPWTDYRRDKNPDRLRKARYVIVSSVVSEDFGPETFIFPARKSGDIFDVESWMELDGSFRGGSDHEAALLVAGYVVTR